MISCTQSDVEEVTFITPLGKYSPTPLSLQFEAHPESASPYYVPDLLNWVETSLIMWFQPPVSINGQCLVKGVSEGSTWLSITVPHTCEQSDYVNILRIAVGVSILIQPPTIICDILQAAYLSFLFHIISLPFEECRANLDSSLKKTRFQSSSVPYHMSVVCSLYGLW